MGLLELIIVFGSLCALEFWERIRQSALHGVIYPAYHNYDQPDLIDLLSFLLC